MHRLRELINSTGMTQKQFAEELGYTPTAVNNWVCNTRVPDIETCCRLCDYFSCTLDYFLCRSDVPYATVSSEDAKILSAYHSARLKDRQTVDQVLAEYMESSEQKNVV